MNKFRSTLKAEQVERWNWRTLEQLVFEDEREGILRVPVGFESDLASIRILREICRWSAVLAVVVGLLAKGWVVLALWAVALLALLFYALIAGYGNRAAILHDYLYTTGQISRARADAVLYRALHNGDGIAGWRSFIFWLGVRVGGFVAYVPR